MRGSLEVNQDDTMYGAESASQYHKRKRVLVRVRVRIRVRARVEVRAGFRVD